jgi:monoamine oxidase
MSAPRHPVVVVGAGLSGLLAAWLLQRQGLRDVLLLEARDGPGGRILSVDHAGRPVDLRQPGVDRFYLGPSWFWPDMQPQLDQLIAELGLERFAQHDEGDLLVERSPHEAPMRLHGAAGAPTSMRLAGGTGALVSALVQRLEPGCLVTGHALERLRASDDALHLHTRTSSGDTRVRHAAHVLLALPPRLAAKDIGFEPALPPVLARRWSDTATWMAPHAKYVAIYERPFWRDEGLSGGARSALGPMGEIHDVSMPGGHAALFGFLGVPARVRRGVPDDVLRQHCRAQLGRLYGGRAAEPLADVLKDWALDPFTATEIDQDAAAGHAAAPPAVAGDGPWKDRLIGIGSEWSPEFPGYLAGAVDAAVRGVRHLLATTRLPSTETP